MSNSSSRGRQEEEEKSSWGYFSRTVKWSFYRSRDLNDAETGRKPRGPSEGLPPNMGIPRAVPEQEHAWEKFEKSREVDCGFGTQEV